MTVSTDAILCFGIAFDNEDTPPFPWQAGEAENEFDGDLDDWWREAVLGFKHSKPIYSTEGGYLQGTKPSKEEIQAYYDEIRRFDADHPKPPVKVVRHCHHENVMYILAVPSTFIEAERGYPQEITGLNVTQDEIDALVSFCASYGIEAETPRWWLASYWG